MGAKLKFNQVGGNLVFPIAVTYKDDKFYFDNVRSDFEIHEIMGVNGKTLDSFTVSFDIKKMQPAISGALLMSDRDDLKFKYVGERKPIIIESKNYSAYVMVIV